MPATHARPSRSNRFGQMSLDVMQNARDALLVLRGRRVALSTVIAEVAVSTSSATAMQCVSISMQSPRAMLTLKLRKA